MTTLLLTALALSAHAEPPPRQLAPLTLTAAPKRATAHQATYGLTAHNAGKRTLRFALMVEDSHLVTLEGDRPATAWMNLNHPFSTRVVDPTFLEVAPGATIDAGELHVLIEADQRPGKQVRPGLAVLYKRNRAWLTELPVLPLPVKNTSGLATGADPTPWVWPKPTVSD